MKSTFEARDFAADVRAEFFVARWADGREAKGHVADYYQAVEQMLESGLGMDRMDIIPAGSMKRGRFFGKGLSLVVLP